MQVLPGLLHIECRAGWFVPCLTELLVVPISHKNLHNCGTLLTESLKKKKKVENSTIELVTSLSVGMRRAVFTVVTLRVHEFCIAHFQIQLVRNNSFLYEKVYGKSNTEGTLILVRFL